MRASLHADWTWSYWHDGGRIITKQREPWPVGSYRVDLYVAGAKVTSGAFEVVEDSSPASDSETTDRREAEKLAEVAYQNAQHLTEKGKYEEAIQQLVMASTLNPEFTPIFALRGYLHSLLSLSEGKDKLVTAAYRRSAIQDYTIAIDKAVRKGERRPGWYNSRGELYMGQMDYRRALADFDEAIRLDPRDAATFFNRGEVRRSMGDLDGALADHTRGIELDQKTGLRYCHRGLVLLLKRQDAEAQNDFRRCYELEPSRREEFTERSKKVLEERKQKP
jgi:tetratricopeptide (TPR) repeat protein